MNNEEIVSGLGRLIQGIVDQKLRDEVIGGVCIADVLHAVDLSIAYTPVVTAPVPNYSDWTRWVVEVKARTRAGDYILEDGRKVSAYTLKIMRARYLLHLKASQPPMPFQKADGKGDQS